MGILTEVKGLLADLGSLIFPNVCEVCGRSLVDGEKHICIDCLYNLPRCNIHSDEFNAIHQRLMRHVPVEKAASYFYYVRNSPYTELILSAKYRHRPVIIKHLASMFAREIAAEGFFDGIDCIMPVPMYRWKRIKRGYNQTDYIAEGLSAICGLPVCHNLTAVRGHATQTRKSAYERWLNSGDIYEMHDAAWLAYKHILIVDDVITTGATIAACCEAIKKTVPTARISVLSIGLTTIL